MCEVFIIICTLHFLWIFEKRQLLFWLVLENSIFQSQCCYRVKLESTGLCTVKPICWHWFVVKDSALFTAGCQARRPGQLELKTPELPVGFRKAFLKARWGKPPEGPFCYFCAPLARCSAHQPLKSKSGLVIPRFTPIHSKKPKAIKWPRRL